MKKRMDVLVSFAATGTLACALHAAGAMAEGFGYYGEDGPDYWGELNPDWAMCSEGSQQSPVDLGNQRRYRAPALQYSESEGEIFNNGHTIEVELTEGENALMLDGVPYHLLQFHFHTASEHRVQGRGYDMEMHLVHKNGAGELAVVGVFLKRGESSGALEPIFENMPPIGEELNVKHELEDSFNPSDFLPVDEANYRYMGSLTTPPCSEGVRWYVMLDPVSVSDEDMAQFAARISFNARNTQRGVPEKKHDEKH